MKINKMLMLSVATMLLIGACQKPQQSSSESEQPSSVEPQPSSSEAPSSEESSESSESEWSIIEDSGTSDSFPFEAVEAFMSNYDLDYEWYSIQDEAEWSWWVSVDYTGVAYWGGYTASTGEVGVDAIEDQYNTLLAENGIEAIYESNEYYVLDDDGNMICEFFTDSENDFCLYFYGPNVYEKESAEFPMEQLLAYIDEYQILFTYSFNAPASENPWKYYATPDNFWACTDDVVEEGEENLTDKFLTEFAELGYDIVFESSVYYAYYDEIEFYFIDYEGVFYFYASETANGYASSFPDYALLNFAQNRALYAIDDIPNIESEYAWSWYVEKEEGYGENYINLYTQDDGEPGVDAMEDEYVTTLTNLGWTIDDTYYDDDGYYATLGDFTMLFWSWSDKFHIVIETRPVYETVDNVFDAEYLEDFMALVGLQENIPSPVANDEEGKWEMAFDGLYGDHYKLPALHATTTDTGTIGEDSIEDTYLATLLEDGWTIDDSQYDYDGYYAYKGDTELLFWSWKGYFHLFVYPITNY